MAIFEVPPMTLQEAVSAAQIESDRKHFIDLTDPVHFTHGTVIIEGPDPDWTKWRLTIRPQPQQDDWRATIASTNGSQTIFTIGADARNVTFCDLDIIRHTSNMANLIEMSDAERITFDRCRIGSNWTAVGSQGHVILLMDYPIDILVRNCIFFSHLPGVFDRAIEANYGDITNSVRLYNNVVGDHRRYGIVIASSIPGSLVLLRNNIVINHPGLEPHPFAYRSDVVAGVCVASSHNVAFTEGTHEERVFGDQPISAFHTPSFLRCGSDRRRFRSRLCRAHLAHRSPLGPKP